MFDKITTTVANTVYSMIDFPMMLNQSINLGYVGQTNYSSVQQVPVRVKPDFKLTYQLTKEPFLDDSLLWFISVSQFQPALLVSHCQEG